MSTDLHVSLQVSLQVSTDALRTTSRRLRDAVAVAEQVHGHAGTLRRLGDGLGDSGAEQALGHFLSTWSYGMSLVGDDATTLADLLSRSAEAYEALELDVVRRCGG